MVSKEENQVKWCNNLTTKSNNKCQSFTPVDLTLKKCSTCPSGRIDIPLRTWPPTSSDLNCSTITSKWNHKSCKWSGLLDRLTSPNLWFADHHRWGIIRKSASTCSSSSPIWTPYWRSSSLHSLTASLIKIWPLRNHPEIDHKSHSSDQNPIL